MPDYVPSIAVDTVMDALAAFIRIFMPTVIPAGSNVIRGEVNRVSPPPSPYVEITELLEKDLNVPFDVFQSDNQTININSSTQIDVQVDFYGALAGDFCKAVKSAFRTEWGYNQFPSTVRPLYSDDGRQMPLITGEEQYERRWTLTASLQYNPVVTVPQPSATILDATIKVPADFPIT